MTEHRLRPDLRLEDTPSGAFVQDPQTGARHRVPDALVWPVRLALLSGSLSEPDAHATRAWLDARWMIADDRWDQLQAWEAAHAGPGPAAADSPSIPPGGRFDCHGCTACCVGFDVWPIFASEREAITARVAELVPHVAPPPAHWFVEAGALDEARRPTYSLGRQADGRCVFLADDGRCQIHRHLGPTLKPLTCRRFPLVALQRPDGTRLSLRVQCESLHRSHADGTPLAGQTAWLKEVAADPPTARVPRIVRVAGEVFVPFALACAIEQRAVAVLAASESAAAGLRQIAHLVAAVLAALPAAPAPADLDGVDRWLRDPVPRARPLRDAHPAPATWSNLLVDLAAAAREQGARRAERGETARIARENDQLATDILHARCAAGIEGARAPLPGPGPESPAVRRFVLQCFVQMLGSGRAMLDAAGMAAGWAWLAVLHDLGNCGACLLADRAGRPRAEAADWNRALSVMDRSLRSLTTPDLAAGAVTEWLAGADD